MFESKWEIGGYIQSSSAHILLSSILLWSAARYKHIPITEPSCYNCTIATVCNAIAPCFSLSVLDLADFFNQSQLGDFRQMRGHHVFRGHGLDLHYCLLGWWKHCRWEARRTPSILLLYLLRISFFSSSTLSVSFGAMAYTEHVHRGNSGYYQHGQTNLIVSAGSWRIL